LLFTSPRSCIYFYSTGLTKKTETFIFFQISDVGRFRRNLLDFVPLVKTVAQVQDDLAAIQDNKKQAAHKGTKPQLIPLAGANIAFSRSGLTKIGITDNSGDVAFEGGQLKDAEGLGDKGTKIGNNFDPDWEPVFKRPIHGVILVAGDSHPSVDKKLYEIEHIFGVGTFHHSIHEVARLRGDVRPGEENGHEHFGFQDGISNPSIIGFDKNPLPGPKQVHEGVILVGRDGDQQASTRPPWAVDGSFLVFRHLFQLVPEFDSFLKNNPIVLPGLTREQGSELLGARLVGRWKSGAPIDITPLHDDKALGADPTRNNNFEFTGERDSQTRCPFAAHVRKTNPRGDLEDLTPPISIENRRIIRRGIPFGPEVTTFEHFEGQTHHGRGLLFACYQSSIDRGFQFIQKSWANAPNFPFGQKTPATPGIDPIIGQVEAGAGVRAMSGTNPNDPVAPLSLPQWVFPRGGEYFFSPSLKALKVTLASEVEE